MNADTDKAQNPAEPDFWQARWRSGETRWDLGRAYPGLGELLEAARRHGLLPEGGRILEPGAGRAHTGAALARAGFQVVAFDVVPEAIAAARALYGEEDRLELVVADALSGPPAWRGAFDAVFDRAMMCALPESKRRVYARALFDYLTPRGVLLSAVVAARRENPTGGPPFAVSKAALDDMLRPGFECLHSRLETLPASEDAKAASELLSVWRRRDPWDEGR